MPRKPASEKKEPAKKTVRKKKTDTEVIAAPVVEETPVKKKRGRKPAVKAVEPVTEVKKARKPRKKKKDNAPVLTTIVQLGDTEFDITGIAEKAYKSYKSVHKRKVITDFCIYVKPEENAAYFTINGEGSADYKIDL